MAAELNSRPWEATAMGMAPGSRLILQRRRSEGNHASAVRGALHSPELQHHCHKWHQ